MSDPLSEDRLPTWASSGSADPTPPPEGSIAGLPTLAGPSAVDPPKLPAIPGYEILGVLGRGGMGVVYKARHLRLRRLVALKLPRAGAAGSADLARFEREASVTARLSHPGIVQIYDVGEYADPDGTSRPYIAFELVPGTSLDQFLRQRVLTPREAASLLLPLARAMQVVHEAGVVHRDLKPANVLLASPSPPDPLSHPNGGSTSPSDRRGERERGSKAEPAAAATDAPASPPPPPWVGEGGRGGEGVKVTDFGLAHLLGADSGLTHSGQLLGTPSYMPPEQVEGRQGTVGPAVDVYSLGAILYECLTGRPPFKGASLTETLNQVANLDPVPVRRLRPQTPRDLETICLECLQKEPGKRYPSAKALAEDLESFLGGKSIKARPVSPFGRLWRACRRRPATAAVTAVAVVAILGLAALGAWVPARLKAERAETAAAGAEAEANRALAEKNRAVAVSNRYHSLTREAARLFGSLEPGWPGRGLAIVREAASLDTPLRDPAALRGQAAGFLAATDLRPAEPIPLNFAAGQLAFHPRQDVLAVGQFKAWWPARCAVVLLEVPSGKVLRTLTFTPGVRLGGGKAAQDGVCALAFSPDGRWLVAATRTGRLHRWDLDQAGTNATSWGGFKLPIRHLCFDGEALFSAGEGGVLRRWSISPGWKQTHEVKMTGQPLVRGGELLLADGDRVHFLRPADLTPLRPAAAIPARLIAAGPPTAPAVVAQGQSVWLFDPARGQRGSHLRRKALAADEAEIDELRMHPDGSLLVSASEQTRYVRVWDTASSHLVAELYLPDGDCRAAFSASGGWLAVLAAREVRLVAVPPREVQTLAAIQPRPIQAAAWVPGWDELACVSGYRSRGEGEVSVWPERGAARRRAVALPEGRLPVRLVIDPAGARLALTDDGGVSLLGTTDLAARGRLPLKEVHGLSFGGDRLWAAHGVKAQAWLGESPGPAWGNGLSDVLTGVGTLWGVAAGESRVVVAGKDGSVRVLDARTAKPLWVKKLSAGPVQCVAMDRRERWALAGLADGGVRLLDLDAQEVIVADGHRSRVTAAAFLPGGRAATGSADGTVRLWEVREGLPAWLTLEHGGPVVGLSAEGDRLAVVLAGDRAVRVWHLDRLRERLAAMGLE